MKPHTAAFHRALIRALREIATAWERWVTAAEKGRVE
jgi:hypothetical protein